MRLHLVRQQHVFYLLKSLVLRIGLSEDFRAQWPVSDPLNQRGPRLGYLTGLAVVVEEPWDAGDILEPAEPSARGRQEAPQKTQQDPTHIVILTERNGDVARAVWADEIYAAEREPIQAKI